MILIAAQLAAVLPAMQVSVPRAEEVVTYVVRPGDTLEALSRAYLVPERDWRALRQLSGVRDPRRLPTGRTLAIPRSWLRYKVEPARLASYRGSIAITVGGRGIAPAVGVLVGEGSEIATGANSFVTLALADRSKVVIASQSRVRVRELRRILLTGAIDYRIEVLAGRLETKVTPVGDPSGRYRIDTPISMTAVRGTEFRIGYRGDGAVATTEVIEGSVAVSSTGGERELLVQQTFGATTGADGESHIAALLPAPQLADPGRLQTHDTVEFRAMPVSGAAAFRIVIAADAGFVENLAEQTSTTGAFSLPEIPNGNLFARISAIGSDGLEGLAQSYSFRRQLASIHAEVSRDDAGFRFRWFGAGEGRRRYRFQLLKDAPQGRPVVDEVGLSQDALTLRSLPPGIYFWRIGLAQNTGGEDIETWTELEKLIVAPTEPGRRKP